LAFPNISGRERQLIGDPLRLPTTHVVEANCYLAHIFKLLDIMTAVSDSQIFGNIFSTAQSAAIWSDLGKIQGR
jgi:hypothetical protein